jgi:hypothetical protein
MTAPISSSVAEKALCSCPGLRMRIARRHNPGAALWPESAGAAITAAILHVAFSARDC